MSQDPKLRIEKLVVPGGVIVRLSGEIDADAATTPVLAEVAGLVVLDLDGVRRITSFGVREWIRTLKSLAADAYCFINARPPLVSQFSMVAGFAGQGALVTLYLPYVCDHCEEETEILVDLRNEKDALPGGEPRQQRCATCGGNAEFDDVPATYLSFVAAQRPLRLPPGLEELVERALGKASSRDQHQLSAQKEVHGKVTAVWLQGRIDHKSRFKRLLDGLEGVVVVVLAGVTEIAPEAAHRLGAILHIAGAEVYLARLPLRAVTLIDDDARSRAAGRVATVCVPGACGTCGPVEVELNAATLKAHLVGGQMVCPSCGGGVLRTERVEVVQRACSLMAAALPVEVRTYLDAHPGTSLARSSSAAVSNTGTSREASDGLGGAPLARYQVVRRIGRGRTGELFLANQRGPEGFVKRVVLKKILPELSRDEQFSDMFLHEARVAAAISHPNVVQIFDLGRDDDAYFVAMEYVSGWHLGTVLRAARRLKKPVPIELACRITSDVCAALDAAHRCRDAQGNLLEIVHRDVSPNNVLLSSAGAVKLTDFGVSKVTTAFLRAHPGQTKRDVYMAPEQIDGRLGPVDARSDVFATGLLLWDMLTGAPLFQREDEDSSMQAVLHAPIPKLRELRADCPRSLEQLVEKAIERDLKRRFRTARDLQFGLETALMGIGRPATSAHLAHWLEGLTEKDPEIDSAVGMRPLFDDDAKRVASADRDDTDIGIRLRAASSRNTMAHEIADTELE